MALTAFRGEGACSRWGAKPPPLFSFPKQAAAAQPSGSKLPRHGGLSAQVFNVHNFLSPHANHRLSFKQVRSICVNGSVDYGRFVANRFE